MSEQLSLDSAGANGPIRNEIEESYRVWLGENPEVFILYEQFAKQAAETRRKFSISLLTERIRWEAVMTWGPDRDGFKVNNNFLAYIARDLVALHPDLQGYLTMRTVREEA